MNNNMFSYPFIGVTNGRDHRGHLLDDESYWDEVVAIDDYEEDEEEDDDDELELPPDEAETR